MTNGKPHPLIWLGDPYGLYLDAGFHYIEAPLSAIFISKQPNATFEESIESITHEYLHYLFERLLPRKDNGEFLLSKVQCGMDILAFQEKTITPTFEETITQTEVPS